MSPAIFFHSFLFRSLLFCIIWFVNNNNGEKGFDTYLTHDIFLNMWPWEIQWAYASTLFLQMVTKYFLVFVCVCVCCLYFSHNLTWYSLTLFDLNRERYKIKQQKKYPFHVLFYLVCHIYHSHIYSGSEFYLCTGGNLVWRILNFSYGFNHNDF